MKRDLDLLRKILLAIENADEFCYYNGIPDLASDIGCSNLELVSFHVSLLVDNNYIEVSDISCCGINYDDYVIKRLTADGCDYLDNIRNDTIWNRTKEVISNAGGTCALDIVKSIAGKIILNQAGI